MFVLLPLQGREAWRNARSNCKGRVNSTGEVWTNGIVHSQAVPHHLDKVIVKTVIQNAHASYATIFAISFKKTITWPRACSFCHLISQRAQPGAPTSWPHQTQIQFIWVPIFPLPTWNCQPSTMSESKEYARPEGEDDRDEEDDEVDESVSPFKLFYLDVPTDSRIRATRLLEMQYYSPLTSARQCSQILSRPKTRKRIVILRQCQPSNVPIDWCNNE